MAASGNELGFIKGKVIEVLLNAPLQDPIKYQLMGYEVSLRRVEAQMIEIVSLEEAKNLKLSENIVPVYNEMSYSGNEAIREDNISDNQLREIAMHKRRTINVALIGNPNCGKTSLFNFVSGAHERVGNYSGVTVDACDGYMEFEGYRFHIVDLPASSTPVLIS